MVTMSLSGLQKTGQFVSPDMFGANAVFSDTNDGVPTDAYYDAAQVLGVQNIRFGGGQADLDPTKANDAGAVPIDGVSAINIVDMPDGALRAELVNFLEWCVAENAAGAQIETTLIIPTKHLSADAYQGFASEIEVFVETVMQEYGDVISAFQIGNEYWEMGETAYGTKASLGATAIANGLARAGIAEADQPDILVQMATAGNAGSEYPAVPGVNDFLARNTAANNRIIELLSDEARDAIDGVTEHYYYNKTGYEFLPAASAVKNINRDYAIWADQLGDDLDLIITEWNIKTTATEQQGIVAASTLIRQFENMIEIGVDGAHIWALDYHSRTALTLRSDEGTMLDDAGRLTNSAQGAVFDLMSDALVGKELISASFANGIPGIAVSSYASADELTFYISSRSFDVVDFTLDLAAQIPNLGPVSGVQISIDQGSSNGRQWINGEDADSIDVNGQPYYYNEHDVDVVLTDLTFNDASQIDLNLNPFEVVELTVSLVPFAPPSNPVPQVDAPGGPATQDDAVFQGTAGNDQIILSDSLLRIDGGAGRDHLFIDAARDTVDITLDGSGTVVLSPSEDVAEVTLAQIERLEFNDGTLALDIDGNAGQIFRLYEASFGRDPDAAGLKFWIDQLDNDVTLTDVAALFLRSAEFSETYGMNAGLADAAYIDLLYQNVLDRTPDQAGYDFWQEQQENGLSREDLLIFFSESAENQGNVAPAIGDGIWYG